MPRPHIEPFVDRDVGFKKLGLPGFRKGIQYKMLSMDKENGSCTMTVQYDAGFKQPPGFSYSEMELFIMEGHIMIGGKKCEKGTYIFAPAGTSLPAFSTSEGALGLVFYNFGPPSFQESDSDHQNADKSQQRKMISSYDGLDWQVPTLFPQTAPGCLLKILHLDPKTFGMTFLYCMVPGFWQDNISYHDVAEEAYHIWGTSWMMQFGDLPTGGYFYRPAYINHGCFKSDLGILAIGRTDGDLHNYFHHDPFSSPEENHHRAAAKLARMKPALYQWILTNEHNHLPHDFEFPDDTYSTEGYDSGIHMHDDGTSHAHKASGAHSHLNTPKISKKKSKK
ncbi:MAG: DUF4437 domain-containing protein [Alphaproteobacteria bacterium]|nr:DUF4437 domain-containing protein [Alphaproteobacteria bacterium]PHY01676.1 MAG: hypothetical protein CK529_02210 [Rhodospirillaceae bacterium]